MLAIFGTAFQVVWFIEFIRDLLQRKKDLQKYSYQLEFLVFYICIRIKTEVCFGNYVNATFVRFRKKNMTYRLKLLISTGLKTLERRPFREHSCHCFYFILPNQCKLSLISFFNLYTLKFEIHEMEWNTLPGGG